MEYDCQHCRRKTPHNVTRDHRDGTFIDCKICGAGKLSHLPEYGSPIRCPPTQYVVGFAFDLTKERVALVRKNRPLWQAGKLNGVGGGWDEGESRGEAVRREFREEAGVDVENWHFFAESTGRKKAHMVHFFWAIADLSQVRTMTDEVIEVHRVRDLDPSQLVRGVLWRIWYVIDGGYESVKTVDTLFE